jgi:hypothetical protein
MLSALILSASLLAPAQCPGGTCQAPILNSKGKPTQSVLRRVVNVDVQPVRKAVKVIRQRPVRRWRIWR